MPIETQINMHNMRSLNPEKFEELKLMAANYDIIMLTETWLNSNKEKLYNIDGYKLYTSHRSNRRIGGGVGVYIKHDLPVIQLEKYSTSSVSAYWFMLQQPKQAPFIYGVVYHPPGLAKSHHDATINHVISTISKSLQRHKSA